MNNKFILLSVILITQFSINIFAATITQGFCVMFKKAAESITKQGEIRIDKISVLAATNAFYSDGKDICYLKNRYYLDTDGYLAELSKFNSRSILNNFEFIQTEYGRQAVKEQFQDNAMMMSKKYIEQLNTFKARYILIHEYVFDSNKIDPIEFNLYEYFPY